MCEKKPDIILFTGFLGSGKTTMLLKTIELLAAENKKCAIIVNEIGEVGIDNRQMRKLGYDVHDLFGGCVCCTLKVTLEATINHLLTEYDGLDYILFEPSGMADPASMYPSMENCGYTSEDICNVFIFDPLRVDLYRVRLNSLLRSSLGLARAVVINKIDEAPECAVREAESMVRELGDRLPVFKMDVSTGLTPAFKTYLVR